MFLFIPDMRENQISEISYLKYLVTSNQDLVRKQTKTFIEWMDNLATMDTTMEQLMTDNQKLYVLTFKMK